MEKSIADRHSEEIAQIVKESSDEVGWLMNITPVDLRLIVTARKRCSQRILEACEQHRTELAALTTEEVQ